MISDINLIRYLILNPEKVGAHDYYAARTETDGGSIFSMVALYILL